MLVALAPDPADPLLTPLVAPDCPPEDVPPLVCATAPALSPRTATDASMVFVMLMTNSFIESGQNASREACGANSLHNISVTYVNSWLVREAARAGPPPII